MIELAGINYWAIVVAWLVNCIIGALWYSPAGFARQWAKLTGVDIMKIPQKEATRTLFAVVVSGFIQALALGIVLNSIGVQTAVEGILAGLLLWFGFMAATTVGVTRYQRLKWKFLWLNASYFLVVMTINSIILAIWK